MTGVEELRPLLFAIAYRILGSGADAEDALQTTWPRYEAVRTPHISTKAFLPATVPGSQSTCCARPASGGRSTLSGGS